MTALLRYENINVNLCVFHTFYSSVSSYRNENVRVCIHNTRKSTNVWNLGMNAMHIAAKFCNVATHCNTLQHTAAHCNTLQHTASHCNTLQHTATLHHTTTLQHPATQGMKDMYLAAKYGNIATPCITAKHCNNTATLWNTRYKWDAHSCQLRQHCNTATLFDAATYCNTAIMPHTATTLQQQVWMRCT